ncbi:hypothetical protein ACTG9Q_13375 [Actinokineospora sp. 24-640]
MKAVVRLVGLLIVLIVGATVAMAAPVPSTSPYPEVPANAEACQAEKLEVQRQQLLADQARTDYDRAKRLYERGAGSLADLRAAERALHLATIALNNAKYAEAACRNRQGNDPKKACVELSLELNRLLDEKALRKALEDLAKAEYDTILRLYNQGAASASEVERARLAWELAKIDSAQLDLKITAAKKALADNPACKDYPSIRPTPTSTTPPTTTPSTTTPTTPTPTTPLPTTVTPTTAYPSTTITQTVAPTSAIEDGTHR